MFTSQTSLLLPLRAYKSLYINYCNLHDCDIGGLGVSIIFLYLLVGFTWVCYMIVATCKLKFGIIEHVESELILIFYKQLLSSIWRNILDLNFALYALIYKVGPFLSSTLELLTDGGWGSVSQRFRF